MKNYSQQKYIKEVEKSHGETSLKKQSHSGNLILCLSFVRKYNQALEVSISFPVMKDWTGKCP
jgi:hypothetical protein